MGTFAITPEAEQTTISLLRATLGEAVRWLEDPAVTEVMLNPDGRVWIDRHKEGLSDTGQRLSAAAGDAIVRLVASHAGVEVSATAPLLSAEMPGSGARFEGVLPPVVTAPAFAIRKPASAVFTLEDYVRDGIMAAAQAAFLQRAVTGGSSIFIAGGTGSGKTTLFNALLAEVAPTGDRVILIEDTRELQCSVPNAVALRAKAGAASFNELVRTSLRLRPDRIPVGEVRAGREALELLKAWGTGHRGGIGTIHAGSARGALHRFEQLIQEVVAVVPRALIAEAIDVVAVIAGRGTARRLGEIAVIGNELKPDGAYALAPALQACGDL